MNNSGKVIYVAGPYTKGDQVLNTRRAIKYAESLRAEGHIPIVPHLTMLWHQMSPHGYQYWIDYCVDLIRALVPDELHRLSGESSGSEKEEETAKMLGSKILHTTWGEDLV